MGKKVASQRVKGRVVFNKLIALYILCFIFTILYFPTPVWHFPDGIGYYSYLPVLFEGKNYDFRDLFELYTTNLGVTQRGLIVNEFSCGSAIVWLPAYLISTIFESRRTSIIFVNFFSSLLGLFSLFFIYKALLLFNSDEIAARVIPLFIFLGSPLLFYTYVIPQNPHTVCSFLSSAYLYYWLSTYGRKRLLRWALLGLLLGFASLVREQEVLFGITLAMEVISEILRERKVDEFYLKSVSIFLLTFLFTMTPYFLNTWVIFGKLLIPKSYTLSLKEISTSSILEIFFSGYHGILWWTPILILSVVGLFLGLRENFVVSISFILTLLCQIFLISSVVAAPGGGGASFGIRYLTDSTLIFAYGLYQVYLLFNKNIKIRMIFFFSCGLLCFWSIILAIYSSIGKIDLLEPYTLKEFFSIVAGNIRYLLSIKFLPRTILNYDEYFFIVLLFILCLGIAKLLYSASKNNFAQSLLVIILTFAILLFDIKIFTAGVVNRVVYKDYRDFLSLNDYRNYYLLAGIRVRIKYYKKIGDRRKYNYYLSLAKNLAFETPRGKSLHKIMLSDINSE
jgi:hypothetical protein